MRRTTYLWIVAALLSLTLAACNWGTDGETTGTARISLTDAPADETAFDNVLITVKAVWFHTSDAAGAGDGGWLRYPLASPRTVDLARLTDGAVSQILNQTLPTGHYRQIRILLAATEDNTYLSPYNNEAIVGGTPYALRVPAADQGIRLAGSFQVTDGGTLNLAIDFDIGHDVVPFHNFGNGNKEFLLKPRLRYFDLDSVGSITGRINAATRAAGYFFVFKAEQLEAGPGKDNTYHVRRFTSTGYLGDNTAFRLSFLKPGTYDVVMRGRNVDTVIVRSVTVTAGADTDLGASIAMPTGSGEFFANTKVRPTGSWVNFYQTLDNNVAGTNAVEYPYEIRYRHIDPFTGSFFDNIALSNGKLHLRRYLGGNTIVAAGYVTPQEWAGGGGNACFGAAADAFLFDRSNIVVFDNTADGPLPGIPGPTFGARLDVSAPATPATASGVIFSFLNKPMTLDNVYLLVVHGGMVVDSFQPTQASGPMTWTVSGGRPSYEFPPLPGNIPGAVYGIDGLGWSPPGSPNGPALAVGTAPAIANLRAGDDTAANFTMNRIIP